MFLVPFFLWEAGIVSRQRWWVGCRERETEKEKEKEKEKENEKEKEKENENGNENENGKNDDIISKLSNVKESI